MVAVVDECLGVNLDPVVTAEAGQIKGGVRRGVVMDGNLVRQVDVARRHRILEISPDIVICVLHAVGVEVKECPVPLNDHVFNGICYMYREILSGGKCARVAAVVGGCDDQAVGIVCVFRIFVVGDSVKRHFTG